MACEGVLTMPAIKLHKRLPNLSPKEEQIVTEMLCEMYASGFENGKPKWIPVSERLPDECKDVLVYRITGCEVTCCTDIKNRKWFGDEICCYEVTHWMPLPEPPKGE